MNPTQNNEINSTKDKAENLTFLEYLQFWLMWDLVASDLLNMKCYDLMKQQ